METALAFPEPLPEDPEVVATALETAGIFGVQGDVREALRWVRRAAEYAGDAGNDDRAFALARAAADLTANLSAQAESAPPPPPVAIAAPAAQPVNDSGAVRVASAPPPPPPPPPITTANRSSNRPQETRPSQPHQAVSVSPIVSLSANTNGSASATASAPQAATTDDEGEITSQHPPHRARPSDSPIPRAPIAAEPAAVAPSNDALAALFEDPVPAQPKAALAAVAPQNPLAQTQALHAPEPAPETPTPEPAATIQEPPAPPQATVRYQALQAAAATASPARTANLTDAARRAHVPQHLIPTQVYEPVQPEAAFVDERVPVLDAVVDAPAERPSSPPQASSRQAARATIEQSQEEGVYILRLLKNGETAAFGTFEALVVLVDPNAELFSEA